MHERIQKTLADLISMLVSKKYADAEALTKAVRLTASDIDRAIRNYGRTLVEPPTEAWKLLSIIPVRSSSPTRWSVVMPLWTAEEERSDLSLECTIIQDGERFILELDDIHVL